MHSKVFDGANCIPTLYRLLKILPTLPGLVVPQPWQYQGQIKKMTVPMEFSY